MTPRKPVCLKHHVSLVSCADCQAVRRAEREAAKQRLAAVKDAWGDEGPVTYVEFVPAPDDDVPGW